MPYKDPVVSAAKQREYGKAYRLRHIDRLRAIWREKAKKRPAIPKDSDEYRRRLDLRNAAARKRRAANRDKSRAESRMFSRRWRTNPQSRERYQAWWKEYNLKRPRRFVAKYGISELQWEEMRESQGGRCAICAQAAETLCVDHDHATGAVRALLCSKCNRGLGQFGDNPDVMESAVAYLRKHSKAAAA